MSNLLTAEVTKILKPGTGNNLIVTVGNSLRSDDGVGPYIVSCLLKLKELIKNLKIINAGFNPENIIDDVISYNPAKIIIIDAADFGENPGCVKIVPEEIIPKTTVSTHTIPLNVISSIIREDIKTEIFFVGIQTKSVILGEGLSSEVKNAADCIIKIIKQNFSENRVKEDS